MNFQTDVFNKATIYSTLFFNVKTVLEYPTLDELQKHKPEMYANFLPLVSDLFNNGKKSLQELYEEYAVNYIEYCKVVTISYCTVYMDDSGKMVRDMRRFTGANEAIVLESFFDYLHQYNGDEFKSMNLCGFNIINDIQVLVKRFILNKKDFITVKTLPNIIKNTLSTKPWDSTVIDVNQLWKFNTINKDLPEFSLISDFCGLKKNTTLMSNEDLSKYYWNNVEEKSDEVFKLVELQSVNQTNMCIQLINELRTF